ncbi:transporter substrate-binding domain-containing protein [Pseudacidovorax sp. NFM-22]|uniref:transporter substrate-binding domain-containing protein n=1 Tax=Pseudacidovorax sp. NFM-22 TaxID=2744469 RepID=UPI001F31EB90|nr:transporter substrate-binding domain-containing protein [Pseudacidovorax sp. NFM-22]
MKLSLLMTAALLGIAGLQAAQAQGQDTLAKIDKDNKITLAYRESSVPFSYLEAPGKPIGFAVELSNAVVAEVKKQLNKPNLEVALMPVTSQNRIPLLTNGTIDLECGSTTNNTARGKDVAFAINHFYTGTRALVKKSSNIKDWADLKGKKVAITTGTTNMLVVRKYNEEKKLDLDIIGTKDHADALLLVESDRAAAFPMDDILLFGLKANAKDPASLEVVGEALQVEPYACMLRKDDPKFKALVDGVFTGLMKSGEFEKMYAKWFMGPIPPKNQAIGLPMSKELKDNLKALSDKPST